MKVARRWRIIAWTYTIKMDRSFPGGNPVNVSVYSLRLGMEASYTGVVGSDKYGQIMIDALKAKGVDTSHVRRVPGSTAITHVELVDGERVFGDYGRGSPRLFQADEG